MRDGPRPVDVHVGRRLRLRRSLAGMSQERLAELLGITYQQVQKYERGANRIGSSRLHDIARFLDVPVAWFFEGMAEPRPAGLAEDGAAGFVFDAPEVAEAPAAAPTADEAASFGRETLEMVRAFNRIGDPLVRRRLFELAKALAAADWSLGTPAGDETAGDSGSP
jgi:transcriptional regulator with XRE-family HTH domain